MLLSDFFIKAKVEAVNSMIRVECENAQIFVYNKHKEITNSTSTHFIIDKFSIF